MKRKIDEKGRTDQKIISYDTYKHKAISLSRELWQSLAQYLDHRNLATFSYLNKNFALIAWQAMIKVYNKKFIHFPSLLKYFAPTQFKDYKQLPYDIRMLQNLNQIRHYYDNRYYTLFDPQYSALFEAIERKDSKAAQDFILARLSDDPEESIIDRVFYQKNSDGETAITLAARYQLQDLLDFCFRVLVIENPQELSRLINIGNYPSVLKNLDDKMSTEALWIFACAYVCNQTQICADIAKKRAWNKSWCRTQEWKGNKALDDTVEFDESESLLVIAILFSSHNLLQELLSGLNPWQCILLLNEPLAYNNSYELYIVNDDGAFRATPTDLVLFGKNKAIINFIRWKIFAKEDEVLVSRNLLPYFIESKDLEGLSNFVESAPRLLRYPTDLENKYHNIDCRHDLLPIGLAIAKNSLEAVKLIVENSLTDDEKNDDEGDDDKYIHPLSLAVELERTEIVKYLLSTGMNPDGDEDPGTDIENAAPIFYAVKQNNLSLVKLLVEHHASLEIKNQNIDYIPNTRLKNCRYPYPLTGAILNENTEIVQYIIKKLGVVKAFQQLQESVTLCTQMGKCLRDLSLIQKAIISLLSSDKFISKYYQGGINLFPMPPTLSNSASSEEPQLQFRDSNFP